MKYGFVYIWFDRKHKRYYIGCRWGDEDDGYICSSRWMRNSYKRRPDDFKRRILARVYTCRQDLLNEEHRWLSLVSDSEVGVKYYNLTKHLNGHWSANDDTRQVVGSKISKAGRGISRNRGAVRTIEQKQHLRECNTRQFKDPVQREIRRKKTAELWQDPEYRARQIEARKRPRRSRRDRP